MRTPAVLLLVAASLVVSATIVTTRSSANVYPNEIRRVYERPVFKLEKGEVVEVIKWGSPLAKIRNRKGRFGWVDPLKLDSLKRPPILNLVIDSESNEQGKPASQRGAGGAAKDSVGATK